MNHSRSLRQLLRVRQLEEEQSRTALEIALGELNRMERALRSAHNREAKGHALVKASLLQAEESGDGVMNGQQATSCRISEQAINRRAAEADSVAARKLIEALTPRLKAVHEHAEQYRAEYLAHRVERRQAETLIFEENAHRESEAQLRAQQAIDDWYGGRLTRAKQAAESRPASSSGKIR